MKKLFIFLIVICLFIAGCVVFFTATPAGQKIWNSMQSTNDKSESETKKKVEDRCRGMIVAYNNDVHTYELYKDDITEYYRSIAEDARIRANQTASQYNEYFEKNKHVWNGNIPEDIVSELEIIE